MSRKIPNARWARVSQSKAGRVGVTLTIISVNRYVVDVAATEIAAFRRFVAPDAYFIGTDRSWRMIARVTALVVDWPPKSGVRCRLPATTASTAASMRAAAAPSPR